ncbi:MAG: RNA 2',3'-cyclic phosphodiesterase [Actinobacteria bacterium ATB1]|nr:RNA 2',3'-cyclic phosphodiesterase [Actinobacteria bacterium ATB1]
MTDSVRLFVAVLPPAEARDKLAAGLGELPELPGGRWVAPDAWHLTLQFLGNVEAGMLDRIRLACAFAAGRVRPFGVVFGGSGAFPSVRRARVVWIGVESQRSGLEALSTAVKDQTAKLGFEPEVRDFRPHLTIGRLRKPSDVSSIMPEIRPEEISAEVSEIALMRSRPGGSGASYSAVDTFPLRS